MLGGEVWGVSFSVGLRSSFCAGHLSVFYSHCNTLRGSYQEGD